MSDMHALDELRGHSLVPSEQELALIPKLYSTDSVKADDKIVYVHYFIGGCDWYIFELDQKEWLAFSWANLNDLQNAELGYISIAELASIKVGWACVERDLHWTHKPFGQVQR
jgi:hypothetical protein